MLNQRKLFFKLRKFSGPKTRAARMARFVEIMRPQPNQRILDLGGSTKLWRFVDVPLDITVLNLPTQSIDEHRYGKHTFSVVRGDATNAPHLNDGSFDIVFSNSVIEHVGEREKQAAFAKEVRRLAPSYFIQTPSIFFPLEAHTGLPLWWYYPESVRSRIIAHWRRTTPSYAEFVEGTRVLKKRDLRAFFPDAVIEPERVFGMTKSYLLWRR